MIKWKNIKFITQMFILLNNQINHTLFFLVYIKRIIETIVILKFVNLKFSDLNTTLQIKKIRLYIKIKLSDFSSQKEKNPTFNPTAYQTYAFLISQCACLFLRCFINKACYCKSTCISTSQHEHCPQFQRIPSIYLS